MGRYGSKDGWRNCICCKARFTRATLSYSKSFLTADLGLYGEVPWNRYRSNCWEDYNGDFDRWTFASVQYWGGIQPLYYSPWNGESFRTSADPDAPLWSVARDDFSVVAPVVHAGHLLYCDTGGGLWDNLLRSAVIAHIQTHLSYFGLPIARGRTLREHTGADKVRVTLRRQRPDVEAQIHHACNEKYTCAQILFDAQQLSRPIPRPTQSIEHSLTLQKLTVVYGRCTAEPNPPCPHSPLIARGTGVHKGPLRAILAGSWKRAGTLLPLINPAEVSLTNSACVDLAPAENDDLFFIGVMPIGNSVLGSSPDPGPCWDKAKPNPLPPYHANHFPFTTRPDQGQRTIGPQSSMGWITQVDLLDASDRVLRTYIPDLVPDCGSD